MEKGNSSTMKTNNICNPWRCNLGKPNNGIGSMA
jgi:hypothetical protein